MKVLFFLFFTFSTIVLNTSLILPVFQVVVVLLYFSVLLGLYVVPLYITSPCIMDPTTLKQRPEVIGHQGAPMVSRQSPIKQ